LPESLSAELIDLQQRCATFAEQVLLNAQGDGANTRDRVREAAKQAGLFAMTQPTSVGGSAASQLALTVARETLCRYNPPHLDAVFGPSPGVLADVPEPLRSSHLGPLLAG